MIDDSRLGGRRGGYLPRRAVYEESSARESRVELGYGGTGRPSDCFLEIIRVSQIRSVEDFCGFFFILALMSGFRGKLLIAGYYFWARVCNFRTIGTRPCAFNLSRFELVLRVLVVYKHGFINGKFYLDERTFPNF